MRTIPLTKGQHALVDDADYEWLKQLKWHATWHKSSKSFYARCWISQKGAEMMHRYILGAKKGEEIDHINRNPLDNRRNNLRFCSRSENLLNRKAYGRSKYRGVTWNEVSNKWQSRLFNKKEQFHLGLFSSEKEASEAYNKKYREIHGTLPPSAE